jgi:hypothetical protein
MVMGALEKTLLSLKNTVDDICDDHDVSGFHDRKVLADLHKTLNRWYLELKDLHHDLPMRFSTPTKLASRETESSEQLEVISKMQEQLAQMQGLFMDMHTIRNPEDRVGRSLIGVLGSTLATFERALDRVRDHYNGQD